MVFELTADQPHASTMKTSWIAPGKLRTDLYAGNDLVETSIITSGGPGIEIDHEYKTYYTLPARPSDLRSSVMNDQLGHFAGQADRELGKRQIGGRPSDGFEIAITKIDPDFHPGTARIWIDRQSGLPLEMEYAFVQQGMNVVMRYTGIRWNAELDPKLFQPVAPAGYAKRPPPKVPSMAELIRVSVEALRTYAELSGGHYPRVNTIYPELLRDEMFQKAGINPTSPTQEQVTSGLHRRVLDAGNLGFPRLNLLLGRNFDAAYYGTTVGPNDKNRVLVRWRLDDGGFQVIFGDLDTDAVTIDELRALEGTAGVPLSDTNGSATTAVSMDSQSEGLIRMPLSLDRVPACHWRCVFFGREGRPDRVEEGWAVRSLGWRAEVRSGDQLTLVVVQTRRWCFTWDVVQDFVRASADGYEKHLPSISAGMRVRRRKDVVATFAPMKPTMVFGTDQRKGTQMEKITFRFLADPKTDGDWPIHEFDPKAHGRLLASPDAKFRTRTFWLDPKTQLQAGRRCGCRVPKWESWIDYPAPDSVPRELFTFRVPPNATLEIEDRELDRSITSEKREDL